MAGHAKPHVRPAKTGINLRSHTVPSESLFGVLWVVKDPKLLHADSEDSEQIVRMFKLIIVFAGVWAPVIL